MKKPVLFRQWILLIAVCLFTQFISCQPASKIEFELTKKGTSSGLTSLENVKSFSLVYNPNANGVIVVTLSNSGSEYTAKNLNASQLSSLLVLLNSKDLQFDTENKEFRLKGGVQ